MTLDLHEMLAYERDDLQREVMRHQGNKLMQTHQRDAEAVRSERPTARQIHLE